MWWWIVVCALIAALIILLFKRMPIEIIYAASAKHKKQAFRLKVYGIDLIREKNGKTKKPKKSKEKKKAKEEKKFDFSEFMDLLGRVKDIYEHIKEGLSEIFSYLGKKARNIGLVIHLDLGFENAAHTGIASGAAYGSVYGAASMVYNNTSMKKENLDIEVNPRFDKPCADLYIKGIFYLSPAHIIRVVLMVLNIIKDIKKL